MANNEMNVLKVGNSEFEIADAKARQDCSDLKDDFNSLNGAVVLEGNLVKSYTEGKIVNVAIGSPVTFGDNGDYGYSDVTVDGGKTYSINSYNFNNAFSVVADSDNICLGRLRDYYSSGTYSSTYTLPSNAKHVFLCNNTFSSTGDKNVVMLQTSDVITDLSVYNTSNYPFGIATKVLIEKLYDPDKDRFINDVLDDIPYRPYINTVYRQYIDKTKWESGYIWMMQGGGTEVELVANASYYAYPAFELRAGKYNVSGLSGNFSFAKYKTSGVLKKFSELWETGTVYRPIGYNLSLAEDAIIYLSNSSIDYSVVEDGEFVMNESNTAPEYFYGQYYPSTRHIFHCGSKRNLNTLRKAIEEATKYFDSVVYVDNETFDLAEEFADELATYDGTNQKEGITLCNRVHVIFASGAKVIFDYSGDNQYVYSCFSPFNAGQYGFTLENAWVESKNCRYSVHDELNASDIPYHNVYKHCTFIHDSSESSWGVHQAIGGGLGRYGDILIEDCYASSVGADTANMPVISYHNAGGSNASKSIITVRNCYIENGTFRCTNNGAGTVKSRAMVSGCNTLGTPYCETTITPDRADNMEIIQWGNTIR